MKKAFLLIFVSIFLSVLLTSCDIINGGTQDEPLDDGVCTHEWLESTCQAPKTCAKCGEINGGIGDHNYGEKTCTSAQVCKTCGIWFGLALGHDYSEATCTTPRTCKRCGETKGDVVHNYIEATCTTPKTCSECNSVFGEALGHDLTTVITEATCTADGSEITHCMACGFKESSTVLIERIDHADLPFVYNGDATATVDGTATVDCPYCNYTVTKTIVGSAALISNAFAGKKISILGDSISTYTNFSSGIAAETTNSSVLNNLVWYGYDPSQPIFGGSSVDSTWWQRTINTLGATRLVNNSNSGESVYNALNWRCMQLHDDTGDNAGEIPDIIFVYLGTNDINRTMGNAKSLTMANIQRMADNPAYTATNLAEAYAVMLYRIQKTYPNAEIYCLTNLERSDANVRLTHAVSEVIREVVDLFDGVYLADIGLDSGISRDRNDYWTYMPKDQGDKSIHPGVEGMKAISDVLLQAIMENSRYIKEDFEALLSEMSE